MPRRSSHWAPTAYLHGNHDPCEACALRREEEDTSPMIRAPIPCNSCGGTGYIALSAGEIVERTAARARLEYWPAAEARWKDMAACS